MTNREGSKSRMGSKLMPLALAALLGGSMLSVPAVMAQSSETVTIPLATQTISKLVQAEELASQMNANPDGRFRVLVQYKLPELTTLQQSAGEADDEAHIAANHATQDRLLEAVFGSKDEMLSGAQSDVYRIERMNYSPILVMHATAEEIDALAASGDVLHIQPDIPVPPVMDQSTAHVDMPAVWSASGTGVGRTVAVLDTGVKKSHEFITSGKVVSEACYNTTDSSYPSTSYCPGGDSSTASGSGEDCNDASGCSHGTHVAGTTSGNNTNRQSGEPQYGMAYDANIIAINVFSKFTSSSWCGSSPSPCVLSFTSDQMEGLERVYALRNTYNIDAANMSLGGGQYFSACDADGRKAIIDTLRAAGIATVIAAGNNGYTSSVGAPGCISTAITVASSLDTSDSKSSFSNWGTLIDVVAPGSNIQSSVVGSNNTTYSNYNGTSMATPHVVGAFAALRELYPTATVTEIENALESTGVGITSSGVTKPRIDMDDACASLGGGTCGSAGSSSLVASILPTSRATQTGGTVTAFATMLNTAPTSATNCSIALPSSIPNTTFLYQTVNGSNVPTGSPNTPVTISGSGVQGFYFALTTSSGTVSENIPLVFDCSNTAPVSTIYGVNTFQYAATSGATADMVSIASTVGNTGYINIPGTTGSAVASVAAFNNGSTATVTVEVTEQAVGGVDPNMPATLLVCRTNSSGTCLQPLSTSQSFSAPAGSSHTFTVFVTGSGTVANNPATNRAHVYFKVGGQVVGSTSVAVKTQ